MKISRRAESRIHFRNEVAWLFVPSLPGILDQGICDADGWVDTKSPKLQTDPITADMYCWCAAEMAQHILNYLRFDLQSVRMYDIRSALGPIVADLATISESREAVSQAALDALIRQSAEIMYEKLDSQSRVIPKFASASMAILCFVVGLYSNATLRGGAVLLPTHIWDPTRMPIVASALIKLLNSVHWLCDGVALRKIAEFNLLKKGELHTLISERTLSHWWASSQRRLLQQKNEPPARPT